MQSRGGEIGNWGTEQLEGAEVFERGERIQEMAKGDGATTICDALWVSRRKDIVKTYE